MGYVLEQYSEQGEEAKAKRAFTPGMELYGYCCGVFGRDSYDTKTIKEIKGSTIYAVNSDGALCSGHVYSWVDLLESSNYFLHNEILANEDRE